MKYTIKQYAQGLLEAYERASDKELILTNFVKLLAKNRDLKYFPRIAEKIKELQLARKNTKEVGIFSAYSVREKEQMIIKQILRDITGQKIQLASNIDKDLVGGVVIKIKDSVIDASVKGKLAQLKQNLFSGK